jgi:Protein of unknown function (DUF3592)
MGLFLLIAGALLAVANANALRLALQSRNWPSAPGVVAETAVRDPKWPIAIGSDGWTIDGVGPSRWQDVLYRYSVSGRHLAASRKYFTGWSENWWRRINYSAPRYKPDEDVIVRYQPTNPTLAVLEPGVSLGLAADYLMSVVLIASGLWFWLAAP